MDGIDQASFCVDPSEGMFNQIRIHRRIVDDLGFGSSATHLIVVVIRFILRVTSPGFPVAHVITPIGTVIRGILVVLFPSPNHLIRNERYVEVR